MKEGTIKDFRIQLMKKTVDITIITGREQVKDTLPYNDSMQIIKKGITCKYVTKNKRITQLLINNIDLMKENHRTTIQQSKVPPEKEPSRSNNTSLHPSQNRSRQSGGGNAKSSPPEDKASAPYNFVPINKYVVPAPTPPPFERYHEGYYTGYIKLDIESLTPLYIRDTYNSNDEKKAAEAKASSVKWENPDFFSPAGIPSIPGSSLRGMVRNLVEIVSYSKMEYVEDKRLYYRKVASKGKYQSLMIEGNNNPNDGFRPKTKAGWLKKENGEYYMYHLEHSQVYRINAKSNGVFWKVRMQNSQSNAITKSLKNFDFYPISFIPVTDEIHKHSNGKLWLRYARIGADGFELEHNKADLNDNYAKGYLVLSGSMGNKKHLHPVIHCPKLDGKKIKIDPDIVISYKDDINREEKADLLKMLEKYPDGVPCFYLKDSKDTIKSIGHTPLFRLAYDHTIRTHIPSNNNAFKGIDLATAIFGDTENFAGRVFFEDAQIAEKDKNKVSIQEVHPRILSNPKPTTFQHYLEQGNRTKDTLLHWGNNAGENKMEGFIRGYKLYWHRETLPKGKHGWQASDEDVSKNKSQYTSIKPVGAGAHFSGCIRFENLSDIELGALLFVLELPPNCAHKIGMGKPLGLGSVSINPSLTISHRGGRNAAQSSRYEKLFGNKEWYLPEAKADKDFIAEFSKHILQLIRDNENLSPSVKDLWSVPRLKELQAILYYDKDNMKKEEWLKGTRYMEIERTVNGKKKNEFAERPVLPSATETLHLAGIIKYEQE